MTSKESHTTTAYGKTLNQDMTVNHYDNNIISFIEVTTFLINQQ